MLKKSNENFASRELNWHTRSEVRADRKRLLRIVKVTMLTFTEWP